MVLANSILLTPMSSWAQIVMNSHNRAVVVVLFLVVCAPRYAWPADHKDGSTHSQWLQTDEDRFKICNDLLMALREKDHSAVLPQDRDVCAEQWRKTERSGSVERQQADLQVDVLEKLLLESASSQCGEADALTKH